MAATSAIYANHLYIHLFQVNYKPGKSEIAINMVGPGAKKIMRDMGPASNRFLEINTIFGPRRAKVVRLYKHLGDMTDVNGTFVPKLKRSIQQGKNAFAENLVMLTSAYLPHSARIMLMHSLVFSRFLYHAGLFPQLSDEQFSEFEGVYNNFWHNLYRNNKDTIVHEGRRLSTKQLFTKYQIMPLPYMLRKLNLLELLDMPPPLHEHSYISSGVFLILGFRVSYVTSGGFNSTLINWTRFKLPLPLFLPLRGGLHNVRDILNFSLN